MKNYFVILFVICLLISVVSAGDFLEINPPSLTDIGDKEPVDIQKNSSSLSYSEERQKELVGYEPAYKNVSYQVEKCKYKNEQNVSIESCWNETISYLVVDDKAQGDPIYEYSEPQAITYEEDKYSFDNKQCWVCDKYMACLSNTDGGTGVAHRAEEFKCKDDYPVIRSGESFKIIDLTNQKVVNEGYDVEEVKI